MSRSPSNYVIVGSGNASLHNATFTAKPDLTLPAVVASAVESELLKSATLPSTDRATSQVTTTINSSSVQPVRTERIAIPKKTESLDKRRYDHVGSFVFGEPRYK